MEISQPSNQTVLNGNIQKSLETLVKGIVLLIELRKSISCLGTFEIFELVILAMLWTIPVFIYKGILISGDISESVGKLLCHLGSQ